MPVELVEASEIKVAPHGRLGRLAYDPARDRVQCHICGRWFRLLGKHVQMAHGWTADDYREEFDLNRTTPLCSPGFSESKREIALRLDFASRIKPYMLTSESCRLLKPAQRSLRLEAKEVVAARLRVINVGRRWGRGKVNVICEGCGTEFWVWPSDLKRGRGRFHDRICAARAAVRSRWQKRAAAEVAVGR